MKIKFTEFLLESAPRLPKDVKYWTDQGKSGKDVCLVFHDDLDGLVSAILMKNYLKKQGFDIKKYGVINYQEGWEAFNIDKKLITIALDYAEDIPGVDYYVDHHGKFTEEVASSQKRFSVKTSTGSAAEGIAMQLGVPFSKEVKDWIDMIDSAKYLDYNINIIDILDFNLATIAKSPNAKLKFAGAMNQLLKRGDHKSIIEVVNACDYPSIYNIYRLFKIFYPKNNPNWRTGIEAEFVPDAKDRLKTMQHKTRGTGKGDQGYDQNGKKIRYMLQKDFWDDFASQVSKSVEYDKDGNVLPPKWKLKPSVYQLIGNLMYVPSGTWANALRAKAIFAQDVNAGIIDYSPELNFVLLQYGNTIQIADLNVKIKDMPEQDLPKYIDGTPIDNLGQYMEGLVKNFEKHLGYQDARTVSGGHLGIGTISNIFGTCKKKPYEDVTFLDLFKNKIINDISGVKWILKMPWNEEDKPRVIKPEEVNKKLIDISDVRTEEDVKIEKKEREILNYIILNDVGSMKDRIEFISNFKSPTIRKIYEIWLDTHFNELDSFFDEKDIQSLYFKQNKDIEKSSIFNKIVLDFGFDQIYNTEATDVRSKQRSQLKRILRMMFKLLKGDYIKDDTDKKVSEWEK